MYLIFKYTLFDLQNSLFRNTKSRLHCNTNFCEQNQLCHKYNLKNVAMATRQVNHPSVSDCSQTSILQGVLIEHSMFLVNVLPCYVLLS